MKVSRRRIAKVIAPHLLTKGNSKAYTQAIASYLLAEHRTRDLDSLLRDIQADWAEAGHVEVITSSAHALDESAKSDVIKEAQRLYSSAKKIIVTKTRDPSIIGGVRLNLPNRQLDLSIEAKLNKLKQLTTGV